MGQLNQQRDEVEDKYDQLQDRYAAAMKRSEPREKEERKQRVERIMRGLNQATKNALR